MATIDDRRQAAIRRLRARREFRLHLAVYLLVNTMLIVIWVASGAGYFWPIWPMGGWGIGLASHAFSLHQHRAVTEDEIQAEMRRERPDDTRAH